MEENEDKDDGKEHLEHGFGFNFGIEFPNLFVNFHHSCNFNIFIKLAKVL